MAPQNPPISSAEPLTPGQQRLAARMRGRLQSDELEEKVVAIRGPRPQLCNRHEEVRP